MAWYFGIPRNTYWVLVEKSGDADLLRSGLAPLLEIMTKYNNGLKAHEFATFIKLFDQYYAVESIFSAWATVMRRLNQSPAPERCTTSAGSKP